MTADARRCFLCGGAFIADAPMLWVKADERQVHAAPTQPVHLDCFHARATSAKDAEIGRLTAERDELQRQIDEALVTSESATTLQQLTAGCIEGAYWKSEAMDRAAERGELAAKLAGLREPTEEMWRGWRSVNCRIGVDGMEEFTYFSGDYGNWLACHQAMYAAAIHSLPDRARRMLAVVEAARKWAIWLAGAQDDAERTGALIDAVDALAALDGKDRTP